MQCVRCALGSCPGMNLAVIDRVAELECRPAQREAFTHEDWHPVERGQLASVGAGPSCLYGTEQSTDTDYRVPYWLVCGTAASARKRQQDGSNLYQGANKHKTSTVHQSTTVGEAPMWAVVACRRHMSRTCLHQTGPLKPAHPTYTQVPPVLRIFTPPTGPGCRLHQVCWRA
jgi:hypothetical protein